MKRKCIGLFLSLVFFSCNTPASREPKTNATKKEDLVEYLKSAQVCSVDADCEYIGDLCSAGCAVTVNKKNSAEARARLIAPVVECSMDCPRVGPPACVKNQCQASEFVEKP
jgi:hypothetical protein